MSLATSVHTKGIHTIDKPRHIKRNPKFLCRLFKGDHLTCLCPATTVVQEAQFLSDIPSGFESYFISQPYNTSFFDIVVFPMQSSANTNLILGGDVSLDHVVSHHLQPVVMLMQSSTDTTPILGSDVSLHHVFSHPFQPMVEKY
jgi:hypothetical protein